MAVWKRAFLVALFVWSSHAATLNLGLIAYDTLIPGAPGSPGVNDFSINNFTGDPAAAGFALPPDFPVYIDAVFQNSVLELVSGASTITINLGNIGPGSYNPASLEFPATSSFSSATFTASLTPAVLILSDGTSVLPTTFQLTAILYPSSGAALSPGLDSVLIQVPAASNTPEPNSGYLVAAAIALSACASRLTRKLRLGQ